MSEQGVSFIPKSGVKTVQRKRGTRRIYLLAYVSYIVFFSTLFVVVGVFLYAATVNSRLTSLKEQLAVEQSRFAIADIEQVKLFDRRMSEATRLLEESSSPSRIFSDIESMVASNIYFSSMTYAQLPGGQFEIELIGRATNFNELINQKDLLSNSQILNDAIITAYDYGLGEGESEGTSGNASLSFTFSDTRDLSVIPYQPDTLNTFNSTKGSVLIPSSATGTTTTGVIEIGESNAVGATSEADDTVIVGQPRPASTESGEATSGNAQTQ